MFQTSRTIRMVAKLTGTVIVLLLLACGAFGQGVFFDDFNYSSSSDPVLLNFGWSPRSGGGGLGLEHGIPLTSRFSLIPLIPATN